MALNWLEQVKADAEAITKRRLEDDGYTTHQDRQNAINEAELASDSISSGTKQVTDEAVQPKAPTPEGVTGVGPKAKVAADEKASKAKVTKDSRTVEVPQAK